MKSRSLLTTPDLIASNYTVTSIGGGRFHHSFTPLTTTTVYEFEANSGSYIVEGERYNIGYEIIDGKNIVDKDCISKTSVINKYLSYSVAQHEALNKHDANKYNNDSRVIHTSESGYYWGKKYAWREFGMCLPKDVFHDYLAYIKHPTVVCKTVTPGYPTGEDSIAYLEMGLEKAIEKLIDTAVMINNGPYFRSPLYTPTPKKKFSIKGINAITDKK
ncbi:MULTISPECIES: hypothetical protein [unclassified Brenneria]|uniref:hypothetical protein n=1 Tax=unclassified Brenneria TaxID=2634434 RepID=UPI0018F0EAD2|nr:hypothetical protein [Brenneria sp. L3-3C-1]MBJ7221176.1 hypothetical protein [Brenneria sp. L3-3C-1]MEE3642418.1 hypothetical protein [Brenneria sp. L3_3C_1]